jgi:hypothetical protein
MKRGRNEKLWFRSKRSVWSWYPASWQGWVTLLFYIGLLIYGSWVLLPRERFEPFESVRILSWLVFVFATVLSLIIVVWTTGGKPSAQQEQNDQDVEQ